jgi:hypothetical protein
VRAQRLALGRIGTHLVLLTARRGEDDEDDIDEDEVDDDQE